MALNYLLYICVFVLALTACNGKKSNATAQIVQENTSMTREDSLNAKKDSLGVKSEYSLENVDDKEKEEFIENLKKIEGEYGQQWDFCTCIIKNDSVVKAFMAEGLSDADMDRIMTRSDYIDEKCQASKVQNPSRTVEDKMKHEKKVKDCLDAAGISN